MQEVTAKGMNLLDNEELKINEIIKNLSIDLMNDLIQDVKTLSNEERKAAK